MKKFFIDDDFLLTTKQARELYHGHAEKMPVIDYHCHLPPAEIVELASCGTHLVMYTTGRGSVAGCALVPVIKVCANPETYRRMADDMDVNAGAIAAKMTSRKSCTGKSWKSPAARRAVQRLSATANSSSATSISTSAARRGPRSIVAGDRRLKW